MIERRRRYSSGFTLLEVIIALAILGLMAGMVFASLQLAARFYDGAQRRLEEQATERILLDQIKRQVGSIFPLRPAAGFVMADDPAEVANPVAQIAMSQQVLFHGEPDFVTFVTVAPLVLSENPGLTVVRYGLAQDEYGDYFLGAMETRYTGQESFVTMVNAPYGRPLALVRDIRQLSFEYYAYDQATRAYAWYSTWFGEETSSVPHAVKISFDDRYVLVAVNADAYGAMGLGVQRIMSVVGQGQ